MLCVAESEGETKYSVHSSRLFGYQDRLPTSFAYARVFIRAAPRASSRSRTKKKPTSTPVAASSRRGIRFRLRLILNVAPDADLSAGRARGETCYLY